MKIQNLFKRNLFAILYFNFKMLPFKQAVRFPFDFYGKVRFQSLKGRIIINTPTIRRGEYQFGFAESAIFPNEETIISIDGHLILNGLMSMGSGSVLEVSEKAIVEIGKDVLIAPKTKILSRKSIKIGSHVRISWEGQVFDSNFHYIRNIETGAIPSINKEVVIGNYNWIGNRVTINKGTRLPNYTIVASNSLCNKDFTKEGKQYIILGGSPAKILSEGYERIFESVEPEITIELSENEK